METPGFYRSHKKFSLSLGRSRSASTRFRKMWKFSKESKVIRLPHFVNSRASIFYKSDGVICSWNFSIRLFWADYFVMVFRLFMRSRWFHTFYYYRCFFLWSSFRIITNSHLFSSYLPVLLYYFLHHSAHYTPWSFLFPHFLLLIFSPFLNLYHLQSRSAVKLLAVPWCPC